MTTLINEFDILFLLLILISGFFSYFRGFSRDTLTIGSWILAIIFTNYAAPSLKDVIVSNFAVHELIANVVSYFAIFVVSIVIFSYIVSNTSRILHMTEFKYIDQGLGFVLGIIKGLVVGCIFYIVMVWMIPNPEKRPDWFNDARSTPMLKAMTNKLAEIFIPYAKDLEKSLNNERFVRPSENKDIKDENKNDSAVDLIVKPIVEGSSALKKDQAGYTAEERDGLEKILFQMAD
jgi:membrane protein required for colicin V production